jgi:hypothetical protein
MATGYAVLNTIDQTEKFMAQRIQTLFIDDLDGGAADGTVRFGLDGAEYEIDLSGEHSEELRTTLGKYIEHSRKVTTRRASRGGRGGNAIDTAKVREWARGNGYDIKDRGRVSADVVEKYQAASGVLSVLRPLVSSGFARETGRKS